MTSDCRVVGDKRFEGSCKSCDPSGASCTHLKYRGAELPTTSPSKTRFWELLIRVVYLDAITTCGMS